MIWSCIEYKGHLIHKSCNSVVVQIITKHEKSTFNVMYGANTLLGAKRFITKWNKE